jgi:SAM-dependent methyltransferase
MDHAYAEAYPELYRRHWWWRARERILLGELKVLLQHRAGKSRILDVGCGAGLFFDALQHFGAVEGIESDATAVALSGRWRANIHQGYLDHSFQPKHLYDLVLMLDVLEHVTQPGDLLRRTEQLLAPGGFVLITVPAFGWLWTRHDELNHHLRRYTARELDENLALAGLRQVRSRYLFQSLVLPKLMTRVIERVTAAAPAVPNIPGPMVNRVIEAWFEFEYRIGGFVPVGSSILMIAESSSGIAARHQD